MDLPATSCSQMELSDLRGVKGSIHFIGVGGIGMSALAQLLLDQGVAVSGSDKEENAITRDLVERGLDFKLGHEAKNVEAAGAVVVSTAITRENPELARALDRGLPVWHRSQMLSCLGRDQKLIAISGTHGKTTTTGMVAQIMIDCGRDPAVVVGGIFSRINSNARSGKGGYFVAEADESDGTHATANPYAALITNIEPDHLENYPGGMEQIKENMIRFAGKSSGFAVICHDDAACREIQPKLQCRVITYGKAELSPQADYTYAVESPSSMTVFRGKEKLGVIELKVPGEHNKVNALGATVIATELGVGFAELAGALAQFTGVDRRFQVLGQERNITVVDDYAHHPTEVAATLQAAHQFVKNGSGASRIVAVFQPHQPGRLRDLWEEFCNSFSMADVVLLADVYVARGGAIEGITSERFAGAVKHDQAHYLSGTVSQLPEKILPYLNDGDLVLTIGAGDITRVGPEILRLLKQGRSNGTNG